MLGLGLRVTSGLGGLAAAVLVARTREARTGQVLAQEARTGQGRRESEGVEQAGPLGGLGGGGCRPMQAPWCQGGRVVDMALEEKEVVSSQGEEVVWSEGEVVEVESGGKELAELVSPNDQGRQQAQVKGEKY